jgi:uncharacterized protein (DUF952 family)
MTVIYDIITFDYFSRAPENGIYEAKSLVKEGFIHTSMGRLI